MLSNKYAAQPGEDTVLPLRGALGWDQAILTKSLQLGEAKAVSYERAQDHTIDAIRTTYISPLFEATTYQSNSVWAAEVRASHALLNSPDFDVLKYVKSHILPPKPETPAVESPLSNWFTELEIEKLSTGHARLWTLKKRVGVSSVIVTSDIEENIRWFRIHKPRPKPRQ